ncbi:hypothetical protein JOD43_000739 [Pullulanibacillus pueri]|uniref:Uncharacterized protein n=1 Tax=Pullulanibacillus pueri TaxID=1437324 RepID=A0A8J3A3D0_9BACL|nr:hypothetical protein [Pullulanibacillus pueri]MBM7680577.1 hypothetical protein [Pullulanibacillus pueri]GGH88728.1 hypothetical protein GCM10007096_41720 [Pullulanibacillus pueri]
MLIRVFFLFIGFGLAVAGGVTIIAFLNLMTTGEGFYGYLSFMAHRVESYLFLSGIILIWLSIYFPSFK